MPNCSLNILHLPEMKCVHQNYNVPPQVDVIQEIEVEWNRIAPKLTLTPGSEVAVCVGSRGIANLSSIVKGVVDRLRAARYKPFITPAMGSHGGATREGQIRVLHTRGVSEDTVGVPIRASMDVVPIGEVDHIPIFVDKFAFEAGGIVLINRIKPHTNFIGPTESGLLKMMAVGLGNQVGAEHYHRLSVVRDYYSVISTAGRELIKRCNVLFGVGLVENQHHEICMLKIGLADKIEGMEISLLKLAKSCLPMLPLNEIDLLVVDEMGKDISGEGIDPNVVGRDVCECGVKREGPQITRIFVRDLSAASEGSALGIGQADFTTKRLVEKIDFQTTSINCLTCCCPESGKLPLTYVSDREALAAALMTIRPYTLEDVRIVYIKNTMDLREIYVSEGCLKKLLDKTNLHIGSENNKWRFDENGNIISWFRNV